MACMVYAHGGGGVVCEPLDMICTFRYVALLWNACIIMPRYRLGPEFKNPTGILDFKKAYLYFHENAATYNINPNRMALAGESGGGPVALGALHELVKT